MAAAAHQAEKLLQKSDVSGGKPSYTRAHAGGRAQIGAIWQLFRHLWESRIRSRVRDERNIPRCSQCRIGLVKSVAVTDGRDTRRRGFKVKCGAIWLAAFAMLSAMPCYAFDQRDLKSCDQSVDWDRKIAGCTKLLAEPRFPPAALSSIYAARGTGYTAKNDFAHGISDFDEALRLNPKNSGALINRGAAWVLRGEPDKAIADLDAAVALDPKNPAIFSSRGAMWRQLGQFDKSIADLTQAIQLEPKVSQAYNNRALTWKDAGEYDRAIADFNEAIRINPADEKAYGNRGNRLSERQNQLRTGCSVRRFW